MAVIAYDDLVAWIKKHPAYNEFEMGVDAEVALYISFGNPERSHVDTETLELNGGLTLAIDQTKNGTVTGIEII